MNFKNVLKNNTLSFKAGFVLILFGLILLLPSRTIAPLTQNSSTPVVTASPTVSKVVKIIDGDSVVLSTGEEVRYIGINTPEIGNGGCFATEAARANSDLVLGKVIRLVKDTSETDKYGRLLRYVYVVNPERQNGVEGSQEVFVNDYLVKEGFAKVMTVPPDTNFSDKFAVSENYARQNLLGLWGECREK